MCFLWRPSHSFLKTPQAFLISVVLQTHLPYISLLLIPEVQLICSTFLHDLERKRKKLRNHGKGEGMDILKKTLKLKQEESTRQKQHPRLRLRVFLWFVRGTLWKKNTMSTVRSLSWRWPKACYSSWDRAPLIAAHRLAQRLEKKTTASHAQPRSPSPTCLFTSLLV